VTPPESDNYRLLVENVSDGVYRVDRDRTITAWNRGAATISGFAAENVIGRRCRDRILNHVDDSGRLLCNTWCPLAATMIDGQPRDVHVRMTKADGSRLPVWVRAIPIRDPGGEITGAMEIFSDDTPTLDAHGRAKELMHTALADPVTGLGSRVRLEADLASRCENWNRSGWAFGMLLVTIDPLESISTTPDKAVGDQAMALVARTLTQTLTQPATIARYGDDRFAILQPCLDAEELRKIAVRLRRMVAVSRLTIDDERIRLTISVGGTMATGHEQPDAMLNRVNRLLHEARQTGPNTVAVDVYNTGLPD
jgi:diguanylate cyclase (GGDEF)-like protein/PAS domain S-box-containing protein